MQMLGQWLRQKGVALIAKLFHFWRHLVTCPLNEADPVFGAEDAHGFGGDVSLFVENGATRVQVLVVRDQTVRKVLNTIICFYQF